MVEHSIDKIKQIFFCKIVRSRSFYAKQLLLKCFFEHHKFCNYVSGSIKKKIGSSPAGSLPFFS